jgi:nitrous oxidase accessory protein NosD
MHVRIKSLMLAVVTALVAVVIQFGPALAHEQTIYVGKHQIPIKQPTAVQASNSVNVRDYGATGNGVTDDGPYIQNAINAATPSGAGVFFPAGTYLFASSLVFNGLAVTGVGPTSTLLAANSSAQVVLTGTGPSIQYMQISTQGLTTTSLGACNVYAVHAVSFTVSNNTITQGGGFWGVSTYFSSIGAINSNYFNGDGSTSDTGVYTSFTTNCSVNSNVFQNEGTGVYLFDYSQFMAVQNNVIGNVTYPTQQYGVYVYYACNYVTVSGNTIQMAASTNTYYPIYLDYSINLDVTENQTWGGWNGIYVYNPYPINPGFNSIMQNTIHNCGSSGIYLYNYGYAAVTLLNNNVFGECGLFDTSANSAVIYADGTAPYLASTQIMNNSYQGHTNIMCMVPMFLLRTSTAICNHKPRYPVIPTTKQPSFFQTLL